ncbi:hypothetical protein RRG08_016825 [Elysia crispata]|uniref:Uncharacterized protein n=1 Tax=Elysia crispata TaxID=231223 RepID=A0AAE0Z8H9_9GAST|nr:hypothetical protein RRG08_016825 [Elysia crispata]
MLTSSFLPQSVTLEIRFSLSSIVRRCRRVPYGDGWDPVSPRWRRLGVKKLPENEGCARSTPLPDRQEASAGGAGDIGSRG